tara:strand:- start:347 stop:559 length:213 start_codon:yes stop_codon:yes gene_type:complete
LLHCGCLVYTATALWILDNNQSNIGKLITVIAYCMANDPMSAYCKETKEVIAQAIINVSPETKLKTPQIR